MAADSLKMLLFGLVLFVTFGGLIIYGIVGIGDNYGKSSEEIGNGTLSYSAFEDATENVSSSAENYRERFSGSGKVDDVDDTSGIFSILTDVTSLFVAPFKLIAEIIENILGVPTWVTSVLLGLVALSIIFGIWRVLRTGD